jgi:hypothetical protein
VYLLEDRNSGRTREQHFKRVRSIQTAAHEALGGRTRAEYWKIYTPASKMLVREQLLGNSGVEGLVGRGGDPVPSANFRVKSQVAMPSGGILSPIRRQSRQAGRSIIQFRR